MATLRLYTVQGAAKYKRVTYPTVQNAIRNATETGLSPIKANEGVSDVRPVELLTKEQLDAWNPIRRSRLTEDQKIERAAKMLGITPAQMKAALKDKR